MMVAGEQCVAGPAVCPGLLVGSSSILFFYTEQSPDVGANCLLILAFVHVACDSRSCAQGIWRESGCVWGAAGGTLGHGQNTTVCALEGHLFWRLRRHLLPGRQL